jgi:uncharacterized LabA/DUF88 family protein
MSKNVAVFVDVANIFYAAKAANVDIDYVTLLKAAVAGRDFVRAYAYTGLDPENENQRNFHQFLARHGYKVVSKDIRKYGDGKVKANLDIELVVDMMKTARNLDVAIVVSGDGDFAPAIRAVQEMGVRVEVISFRGNTSSDLIDVADIFTDITQIAKVEKGSRSGRRVAGDEADLSMTEVPEKQTEGPSRPRSRRGGRGRAVEKEVAAERAPAEDRNGAGRGAPPLTVLPGEKLSRAGAPADGGALEAFGEGGPEHEDELSAAGEGAEGEAEGPRRRRRRRGGRGRGRGRGTEQAQPAEGAEEPEDDDLEVLAPRPAAQRSSFGSVWDSQIGMPSAASPREGAPAPLDVDEEEFEEPKIPEYLIAERRRGQGANRGGRPQQGRGRGRNAAYAAAVERERFGGRGGGTRFAEPPRSRPQQPSPRQEPRRESRPQPARAPRGGGEPWSEVPPELEEMLRAQLQVRPEAPAAGPRRAAAGEAATAPAAAQAGEALAVEATAVAPEGAAPTARRRSTRTTSTAAAAPADVAAEAGAAPKRRTTRRAKAEPVAEGAAEATQADATSPSDASEPQAAPKRRTRTTTRTRGSAATTAAPTDEAGAADADEAATEPKPRTRRRTAAKAE